MKAWVSRSPLDSQGLVRRRLGPETAAARKRSIFFFPSGASFCYKGFIPMKSKPGNWGTRVERKSAACHALRDRELHRIKPLPRHREEGPHPRATASHCFATASHCFATASHRSAMTSHCAAMAPHCSAMEPHRLAIGPHRFAIASSGVAMAPHCLATASLCVAMTLLTLAMAAHIGAIRCFSGICSALRHRERSRWPGLLTRLR